MAWARSVVVTGGTANLGYHAAMAIARAHPDYLVVISSRSDKDQSAEAINRALGQTNTIFKSLDLSDLANVREYAGQWDMADGLPPIQSLVLNAGLQLPGALTKTPSGLEATFATNHVGHALLFHLLLPHLADGARVVVTASGTHDPAQKTGLPDAVYTSAEDLAHPPPAMVEVPGRQRYASSKLANVLWTYALSRRLSGRSSVTVNAMDPGLMPGTGLAREGTMVERVLWSHVMPRAIPVLRRLVGPNIHRPEESGQALAHLAVGDDVEGISGRYFEGTREIRSSEDSYVREKQDDLWRWTVDYLAQGPEEAAKFDRLEK